MHHPSGIWLWKGPWPKIIFFFFFSIFLSHKILFSLSYNTVLKYIFPFITCLHPFAGTYIRSTHCGYFTPLSKCWDKAETRDRVLLPAAHGFPHFCVWLWLYAQAPAQQKQPAQHCSVQRQLGAACSSMAKKWWFSTVILSQPKTSLDCKSSNLALLVMRAKLFADNNITWEGGTSSPCLPAGLGSAVRLLIFTLVAWSNQVLVETSSAMRTEHTCSVLPENTFRFSIKLWGLASRQGEGKGCSALMVSARGQLHVFLSETEKSRTWVKFRLILD